eukprot:4436923-Amphidinium_carterae.1
METDPEIRACLQKVCEFKLSKTGRYPRTSAQRSKGQAGSSAQKTGHCGGQAERTHGHRSRQAPGVAEGTRN